MVYLHVHKMPSEAKPPPDVPGVHYTLDLPDFDPEIKTWPEFLHWIQDNPGTFGQFTCCLLTLFHLKPP